MYWNPISRRHFLQGLGGFTLALPFLPSLAMGQSAAKAKYFIYLFHANGVVQDKWYPSVAPNINVAENIKALDLTKLSGPVSDTFNTRFDRYKSKMLLLRGLDGLQDPISGHDENLMLGGKLTIAQDGSKMRQGHVTIDQELARSEKVYPSAPKQRSLLLMAHDGWQNGTQSTAMIGGKPTPLAGVREPIDAWNLLFKDFTSQPDSNKNLLAVKAVDAVYEDYKRVVASTKLSLADKQLVESHMTFLSELENKINATTNSCQAPTQPPGGFGSMEDMPKRVKLQADILVAAIRCGMTKIGGINYSPFSDNYFYNFLSGLPNTNHHELAHNGDWESLQIIRRFLATEGVAYLLDQLDVVEDSTTGKTYLDNAIVFWGSENHTGYDHYHITQPVALFGGGGGYLKTGYYVDYRDLSQRRSPGDWGPNDFFKGLPYNQLLVTLLQAYGLAPSDYENYGQQGWGDYSNPYNYDISNRRAVLPFVVA